MELRMERQKRLTGEVPLKIHTVIEESVLRRVAGTPSVMREQLEHVLELAELPNVTLQVLPTAQSLHAMAFGDFEMLSFPSGREIVYLESLYANEYVHDKDAVHGYELFSDRVSADVLDEERSVEHVGGGRRGVVVVEVSVAWPS